MTAREIYDAYIESDQWKRRRELMLAKAGSHCQLCRSTKRLNVHHNFYGNLGHEPDEDLVVLCKRCHDVYHVHIDERTAPKLIALKGVVPNKVDALRLPEKKSKNQMRRERRASQDAEKIALIEKFSGTNGVKKTIVITKGYVDNLITIAGGITNRGLLLLGETIPPKNGWRQRAIGRTITVDEGELMVELEFVRLRRLGGPLLPGSVRREINRRMAAATNP